MACVDSLLMDELKLLHGRFKQSFEVSSSFGPSVLEGAWHGHSLMDSLDRVDLGQAVARFIEGRHTIREITIHCARHTLAVLLLKKTGNLRQVQKQLGHASPATTANMYADISFEDMQDGLNGLYEKEQNN